MQIKSPKIYTVRNVDDQHGYMWSHRRIEEEIACCSKRNLSSVFSKYLPPNGKLLEAGCGLCSWLITLHKLGYEVEGVDYDVNVIRRIEEYDPTLKVSTQDVLALSYEDCTFDAYISLGVVEHFEQGPDRALKESNRVLKPDGVLLITVPYNNFVRRFFYHPLRNMYFIWKKLRGIEIHFAEYRYNKKEFCSIIEASGYSILETGVDDFNSRIESMGLWADWPPFRSSRPYAMNIKGKIISACFSISKWLTASGIYVVAKKKCTI